MRKKYRKILLVLSGMFFLLMLLTGYFCLKDYVPDELCIVEDSSRKPEDIFDNPLLTWEDSIPVSGNRSYMVACRILHVVPLKEVKVDIVSRQHVQTSGAPVGIYMATEGILIVDTEEIRGADGIYHDPAKNLVQPGDYITAFNRQPLSSKDDLIDAVRACDGEKIVLSLLRDDQPVELSINPIESPEGNYKLGIWVRDDTQGIGTLTYVKEDGSYGALGHGISDVDTGGLLKIRDGKLYEAEILGIHRGRKGVPGELSGLIKYENDKVIGSISDNSDTGIYGTLSSMRGLSLETMEIGYKQEMELGEASILCGVDGAVQSYQVEITQIDMNHEDTNKSFVIRVTDDKLLKKTGGIVQGMSGSPVLQNGRLVGAVTHVFVQDSTCVYGIFIENML